MKNEMNGEERQRGDGRREHPRKSNIVWTWGAVPCLCVFGIGENAVGANRENGALRELFADEMGGGEIGLGELLSAECALLGLIETLEFDFHELHVLLLGDHAVPVGIHEEKKLADIFLAHGQTILGLRDRGFLSGGGSKKGHSRDQHYEEDDEPRPVCGISHDCLLGVMKCQGAKNPPWLKGMYTCKGREWSRKKRMEFIRNSWGRGLVVRFFVAMERALCDWVARMSGAE
jgi:hypothetical protein